MKILQAEETQKSTALGRILMLSAALLWGLAGVCVKSVVWSSMSIIAVRSLISLIMFLCAKHSLKVRLKKENLLAAASVAATGFLYIEAIKLTTAGTAIVLQYFAPMLVFLYSCIFQGKKARPIEVILSVTAFLGCALSFVDTLDFTHLWGNILAILSAFTFAAQIIFMNHPKCDAQDSIILSNLFSFIVTLPFFFTDPNRVMDFHNILWVVILGVFQYGMANFLFTIGIKKMEKVEASLLLMLEPVFNPIVVAFVNKEYMGTMAVIGSVIVVISVALYGVLPKMMPEKPKM